MFIDTATVTWLKYCIQCKQYPINQSATDTGNDMECVTENSWGIRNPELFIFMQSGDICSCFLPCSIPVPSNCESYSENVYFLLIYIAAILESV